MVIKSDASSPPGRWVSLWVNVAVTFPCWFSFYSLFKLSTLTTCVNTHTEQRQTESWGFWSGCTIFIFLFSELDPGTSYVHPAAGSGTWSGVWASESGGRRLLLIASRRKWQRRRLWRLTRQRARAAAVSSASRVVAGMRLSSENTLFQLSPFLDSLIRIQERTC